MNFFMRVVFVVAALGCMSPSPQVIAMSDEDSAYLYDVDTLKSIYTEKRSVINLWKSGLIMLEDSRGKVLDVIEFIKSLENYFVNSCKLDQNRVTAENVCKVLGALQEIQQV